MKLYYFLPEMIQLTNLNSMSIKAALEELGSFGSSSDCEIAVDDQSTEESSIFDISLTCPRGT